MFTLEEIKSAHQNVKSGADFPAYVSDLKDLGVEKYESFVLDGHVEYYGANGYFIDSGSKYSVLEISATGNIEAFLKKLDLHQKGETDYFTFCADMAKAGVEKWVMDMYDMTCIYYDKAGAVMLSEVIPN